jgi:hypothetical protein
MTLAEKRRGAALPAAVQDTLARISATPDYAKRLGVRQSSGTFERGCNPVGVEMILDGLAATNDLSRRSRTKAEGGCPRVAPRQSGSDQPWAD